VTITNHNTVGGCLPALVAAYYALQDAAASRRIAFGVADYGGVRDAATTAQLQEWEQQAVAAGQSPYPVAPWGQSKHDVGAAFDARIIDDGGWPDPLAKLGELAPQCGLTWGGTWPKPDTDPRHFELEATLAALRPQWAALVALRG
jgi:D-alanyl-D-alanine carboxypeptidase